MAVFTGVCFYYVIYTVGVHPTERESIATCRPFLIFYAEFTNLMKLNSIFVNLLPTLILILLMLLIPARGYGYYRKSLSSPMEPVLSRQSTTSQSSHRVTNVVFPMVVVMLVLTSPYGFVQIYMTLVGTSRLSRLVMLSPLFSYLHRLNLVIKLYVYLVFSPPFRRRTRTYLVAVFRKVKDKCLPLDRGSGSTAMETQQAGGAGTTSALRQDNRGNYSTPLRQAASDV